MKQYQKFTLDLRRSIRPMGNQIPHLSWLLLFSVTISMLASYCKAHEADQRVYIIYMGEHQKDGLTASSVHLSMLEEALGSGASEALLYSYTRSFNGFVAKLTEEQMQKISAMEGVVSVLLNERKELHTTGSWDFMAFSRKAKRTTVESDIIVAMLDTGVWLESESFSDKGFGPPPSKWKGKCQSSSDFTCNNKVIGARYYRSDGNFSQADSKSPRDTMGHGSHTASTAAGREVSRASLLGLGLGTARGGVPSARIAAYKICWADGCHNADILAAFDDAIADGVDIISISVAPSTALDYFKEPIAIGSFHAMKKGILTSTSAGNYGPGPATVTNFSPWSLTVAGGTINRKFLSELQLGNGVALNTFKLKDEKYPMIYGGDAPNTRQGYNSSQSRLCKGESLDKNLVKGKIVVCDEWNKGRAPLLAGAVGMVMKDDDFKDVAESFFLPATYLGLKDGDEVSDYLKSTSKPTGNIFKTKEALDKLAPYVFSYSSRGPNPITSDILKPDLTAPGGNILAAWSQAHPLSEKVFVPYNIMFGTSMACPHATAAAAYVKSFHPNWSPAAIKSALMTTAFPMSSATNTDAELAYGAGHINPTKAVNPGLVYDAGELDYVKFLCGQGYDTKTLRLLTNDSSTCSTATNGAVWDLNYPSFTLRTSNHTIFSRSFHRTVTNVGSPDSTYKANVTAPMGLNIQVVPNVLSFNTVGQKQSFVVTVRGSINSLIVSGALAWDDGVNQVRSPVVVHSFYRIP